jgi:hypothetical protein
MDKVELMCESRKSGTNPYVGPRPLIAGEILHGRDREVTELLDLLIAERIVLLHSPSGAGKTSLIQAALVSRLEAEGFEVLPVIRVGSLPHDDGGTPASPSNRYLLNTLLSLDRVLPAEEQMPLEELARQSLGEYLEQRSARRPPAAASSAPSGGEVDTNSGQSLSDTNELPPPAEVLIFDQFEEILTLDPTDEAAKARFFEEVGEALRDRQRWALFSMREEYVAALEPYVRCIPTRLTRTFRLESLRPQNARLAIQEPARQLGVSFQADAVNALLDDLRRVQIQRSDGSIEAQPGPYIEPVQLQVVCRQLWERLPADAKEITAEDLGSVGMLNSGLGEYDTESARWFPVHLSALRLQAVLWAREGRPDGLWLCDHALVAAENWIATNSPELTPVEREFLEASQEARSRAQRERQEQERAAYEENRQRELAAVRERAELTEARWQAEERARRDAQRFAEERNRIARRLAYMAVALAITTLFAAFHGVMTYRLTRRQEALVRRQETLAMARQNCRASSAPVGILGRSPCPWNQFPARI